MMVTTRGVIWGVLLVILLLPYVHALTPQQHYSVIPLSPYYVATSSKNVPTMTTLSFNPESGVSRVDSAVLRYNAYLTPTVTYAAKVNGASCRNNVTISTAFANAGLAEVRFDCGNVITKSGTYNVSIVGDKDSSAAYLSAEIAYYDAAPSFTLSGTEYEIGEQGKTFITLVQNGVGINDATCIVQLYYPNSSVFIPYTHMSFLNNGIYYYDFTIPNTTGVYPVIAKCTFVEPGFSYNVTSAVRYDGGGTGALSNLKLIDGNYYTLTEPLPKFSMGAVFNVTGVLATGGNFSTITVDIVGNRPYQIFDLITDLVTVWVYNYNLSRYDMIGNTIGYPSTDTPFTYTIVTNASNYVSPSGVVSVLLNDTNSNNTGDGQNSPFSIDFLGIDTSIRLVNSTVTTIAGGGEVHVHNTSATILSSLSTLYSLSSNGTMIAQNVWTYGGNIATNITNQFNAGPLAAITTLNTTINSIKGDTGAILLLSQAINGNVTELKTTLSDEAAALRGINTTINSINGGLLILNATVNSILVDTTSIKLTVNNIALTTSNIQSDTVSIKTTLTAIQGQIGNLTFNTTTSTSDAVLGNISILGAQLVTINTTLNGMKTTLGHVDTNITNILGGITSIDVSQAYTNNQTAAILTELGNIQASINGINSTSINYTEINQSLTGLVVSTTPSPPEFDVNTLALFIYVVMLGVSTVVRKPLYYITVAIVSLIYGAAMILTTSALLGIVIASIGGAYILMAKKLM